MVVEGYRRENGEVGIRNYVVLLPVDDLSNAVCRTVAAQVPGALALLHAYGRLQYGEDLELHFRTLIGTGTNANVAGVIVIGIEPNWTVRVADGVASSGKPVEAFSIEGYGDLETVRRASRAAQQLLQHASELRRETTELAGLKVSIKCGESDTTTGLASCPTVGWVVDRLIDGGATVLFGETPELTGGEHLIASRCVNEAVRQQFMEMYTRYVSAIEARGADLLGSQPTQGNVAGGLSTIEEKALGNIEKTGTKPVVGVLDRAETPQGGCGLYFMDSSSAAAEHITLMCAGGAVLHLFPTGQGNVVGHPVEPVIKVTGNPKTAATMSEHIDLNVSGLLTCELALDQAGEQLLDLCRRTANGRLTCAETLGHREFVLTRLYPSA